MKEPFINKKYVEKGEWKISKNSKRNRDEEYHSNTTLDVGRKQNKYERNYQKKQMQKLNYLFIIRTSSYPISC